MYIRSNCPHCKKRAYLDVNVHLLKHTKICASGKTETFTHIDELEVCDSVSEEEFARCILYELSNHIYDGITTEEFCKLLKKYFGVAAKYCCDIIQRMKIEMDMYCPDRQHLYFVEG